MDLFDGINLGIKWMSVWERGEYEKWKQGSKGERRKDKGGRSFCYWNLREWLKQMREVKQRKWKGKWWKYVPFFLCSSFYIACKTMTT